VSGESWPGARPLEIPLLLAALNRRSVEYVVIGGFALAAHRYVRATDDLDIVPEPSGPNLARLVAVVEELEGEPTDLAGGLRADELPVRFGLESLRHGGSWALNTRHGVLHVMQGVPGAEEYPELRADAKRVQVPDVGEVWFVGRDRLIRMKQESGRLRDQADVEELLRRADV
jgi:hypothetical protein